MSTAGAWGIGETFFASSRVGAVADPIGRVPSVASKAIESFAGAIERGLSLREACDAARGAAWAIADRPEMKGIGCSFAALALGPKSGELAWIGDVHVYRLRDEALTRLSREHSLLNQARDSGRFTEQQLATFPHANVLVRALGMDRDADAFDFLAIEREPNDLFAIMSDGVRGAQGDDLIRRTLLAHAQSLEAGVRALTEGARFRGGRDSLSVVLLGMPTPPTREAESA